MYYKLSQLYLETTRVCIRPVTRADLPAFYEMHSIDEVNAYLPYATWQNEADAKDWFAKVRKRRYEQESEQYVLERKHDRKIIGSCIVFDFDESEDSLEFGYVLNKKFWGQGYMYDAMTGLMAGLSKDIGIRNVRATVNLENTPSLRLLGKLGFSKLSEKTEEGANRLGVFTCSLN